MRVIQLTTALGGGGATNASYRLYRELLARGVTSCLWTAAADETDENIEILPAPGRIERLTQRITQYLGLYYVDIRSSFSLATHPWMDEQSVLHLHNLHGGHFNYLALPTLTARRPAVWTLHDMWALTGHCVHSLDCERWQIGCGHCPYLDTHQPVNRDLTRVEWRFKASSYRRSKLVLVSPSRWLADKVRTSMLGHFPIHHIPNGIDTECFRPLGKIFSRQSLELPTDRPILLWCANRLTDQFKGGDLIDDILQELPAELRRQLLLVTFGVGTESLSRKLSVETRAFGFVESDRLKALLYSSADLLIFPSRAENLPFVVMESLACGLPVVAFRIGGVPEMVVEGTTGHLVPPFDVRLFAQAVGQLMSSLEECERMGREGRALVEREFTTARMADRYLELYLSILDEGRSGTLGLSR